MISRSPSVHTRVSPRFSIKALASAATLFAVTSAAHAQTTVYSTNFSASQGYTENTELTSGQSTTGTTASTVQNPNNSGDGWTTNDPDNNTIGSGGYVVINNTVPPYDGGYVGGMNYVGTATQAFTDGTGAFLGGDFRGNFDSTTMSNPNSNFDSFSGATTTYLYHPFTLPTSTTSYTYSVDSTITSSPLAASATNAYATAQDSFGYAFRNSAGTTLFSLNFTKSATVAGVDAIGYTLAPGTIGASTTTSNIGVSLNGRYHFDITVTSTGFTASYYGFGQTAAQAVTLFGGQVSLTTAQLLSGVAYNTVGQVAADWTLSNTTTPLAGVYQNAGQNSLVFDNYSITSNALVPEPSTYALMGAGFLGLIGIMKFRRRA